MTAHSGDATAIPQRVHLIGIGGRAHVGDRADPARVGARGHGLGPEGERDDGEARARWASTCASGTRRRTSAMRSWWCTRRRRTADNPEIAEARRRGIPAIKRAEMVARLMQGRYSIAVAGTHGKTTTSGLIAHMLVEAELDPTYLIGGEVRSLGTNAAPGEGRYIVVEADEYDRAFLSYTPDVAVVTNIEPDHLDIYGTIEELQAAFAQFMASAPATGT